MSPAPVQEMSLPPKDEPAAAAVAETADMSLAAVIERLALRPDVDVAKLEKIIDLRERMLANDAKAAFAEAFSQMQAEMPVIAERSRTNNGKYADLTDITEITRPILVKHGFALNHRTEWPGNGVVRVVGVLRHKLGHHETSSFECEADESGNKNDVQGFGSTVSYGRRYTTKDLLNIVTRDEDKDGNRPKKNAPAAPDGFAAWLDNLKKVSNNGVDALKKAWEQSNPKFRAHLSQTDKDEWEALKANAETADQNRQARR